MLVVARMTYPISPTMSQLSREILLREVRTASQWSLSIMIVGLSVLNAHSLPIVGCSSVPVATHNFYEAIIVES